METGIKSSDSANGENIEVVRTSTDDQAADAVAASPDEKSPEKRPSQKSLIETTENNDASPQSQPNAETSNTNNSYGLDWQMDQYGHQRHWFRELMDCYNQIRFNCGMFVNNGHVQFFIVLLISINALMMGIGTFDFVKKDPKVDNIFETIDLVFLIIFTVELGMQFIYHGWRLILDGWLVFDTIIIVTSWSFSSVQIIRAFRIFRALRLVTRIKIMKNLILGTLTSASTFTRTYIACLDNS